MKANAPERIYVCDNVFPNHVDWDGSPINTKRIDDHDIEYTRTDAFIEKALKWYCLDCECNDNCKYTKCFFYREYERYLKGETNALPPKFSDRILNEDGSTSDNWSYRHFITKMEDAFIEKAEDFIYSALNDGIMGTANIEDFMRLFKRYMKEE